MATPGTLPEPPAQLKSIQGYMRIAQDIERVDPVVAYWVRLFSTESALKIDRESAECKTFLNSLIIYLENFKLTQKDNEAVSTETVGQAHVENFVVALFNKADTLDREGKTDKNTVRMFYMAAMLFESMLVFGPLTEEVSKKAKYAKFKAAYIQKCIKSGITPKPGPLESSDLDVEAQSGGPAAPPTSSSSLFPTPSANNDPKSDGNASGSNYTSTGVLNIPEVPSDPEPVVKPLDPFIMTPSVPPKIQRPSIPPGMPPSMPPSLPGYSSNSNADPKTSKPSSSLDSKANKDDARQTIGAAFQATNGLPLTAEDLMMSTKYCKFATSALQYDDIPTAVANLQKALRILTIAQKPE